MIDARQTLLAVDDVRVARLLTAYFEHDGSETQRVEHARDVADAVRGTPTRAVVVHLSSLEASVEATKGARDAGGGALPVVVAAPRSESADGDALYEAGASEVMGRPMALARLADSLERWGDAARDARQAAAQHYTGSVVALPRRATQPAMSALTPAQRHIIEMQHRFTKAG